MVAIMAEIAQASIGKPPLSIKDGQEGQSLEGED